MPVGSFLALALPAQHNLPRSRPKSWGYWEERLQAPGKGGACQSSHSARMCNLRRTFPCLCNTNIPPQKMCGLGLLLFEDYTVIEPRAEWDLKTSDLLNGTKSNAGSASRGLYPAPKNRKCFVPKLQQSSALWWALKQTAWFTKTHLESILVLAMCWDVLKTSSLGWVEKDWN